MARLFAGGPGGVERQAKGWLPIRRRPQDAVVPDATSDALTAAKQSSALLARRVQHVSWMEAEAHADSWCDLAARAAAPNVFLEPSFALTAIRHSPPADRPSILLVWGDEPRTRLIGLAAVHLPTRASETLVTFWNHQDTRLGGLLLDDVQDSEALNALVAWLTLERPALRALLCAGVRQDATVLAVMGSPANRRLRLRVVEGSQGRLQAFDPAQKREAFEEDVFFQAKSLARDRKHGDIRSGLEDFLLLDAASAGGARTPLLERAGFATFARAVTRQLSREGKCWIERLTLERRPIASAIMMRSGRETFVWQLAFVRSSSLRPAVRRFVRQIAQDEADAGQTLILACDAPDIFADLPGFVSLVTADILVSPPGSEARDVTSALRRQGRRRFAREIGRQLLEMTGGIRRDLA